MSITPKDVDYILGENKPRPCTHPDHNDSENCQDRAVACRSDCPCCLTPETIKFYKEAKKK